MTTYVLVHGAWHSGQELEPTAEAMRAQGHEVHCPTLAGNRPGEPKQAGLEEAITSVLAYLEDNSLTDVVLMGHSYGGMVTTGVADRAPERIRRLVYWNAFVPNDGEALNDLVPPHYVTLFDALSAGSADNTVMLPFAIWRDSFINDADLELAQRAYDVLNPQPYATFTDPIRLSRAPAEMELPKSYLYCTEDCALPQGLGWHPRLSEKLGLFRFVAIPGSHELCFTNPPALAEGILKAGRD